MKNWKRATHDVALSAHVFVCGNAPEATRSVRTCNAALHRLRMNGTGSISLEPPSDQKVGYERQ